MSTSIKIASEVPLVSNLKFIEPSSAPSVYYNSGEIMSGYVSLVGPDKHRQEVQVIVYKTSLEHFAVVYPQKKVCRPIGVLNLRNTCVERLSDQDAGFVVRERGFDRSMSVTFIAESSIDLDAWISAFTPRNLSHCHQSFLPILEEEEF